MRRFTCQIVSLNVGVDGGRSSITVLTSEGKTQILPLPTTGNAFSQAQQNNGRTVRVIVGGNGEAIAITAFVA